MRRPGSHCRERFAQFCCSDPTATCRPVTNVPLVKSVCLSLNNLVVGARGASGTLGLVVDTTLGQTPVTPLLTFTDNACIGECYNPCGGDTSCAGHGFCVSGVCRCVGAWTGSRCQTAIGGSGFTTCVPFTVGTFAFRPCISLAVTPCNVTWTLYADAQSAVLSGSIPLSSVPTTLTTSSSFALVTITPISGCTRKMLLTRVVQLLIETTPVQLSLTSLVYSGGVLSGNVAGSASCFPLGVVQQSVPFSSMAVSEL